MAVTIGVAKLGVGVNLVDNPMTMLVAGGRNLVVVKSWKDELDGELK